LFVVLHPGLEAAFGANLIPNQDGRHDTQKDRDHESDWFSGCHLSPTLRYVQISPCGNGSTARLADSRLAAKRTSGDQFLVDSRQESIKLAKATAADE
jgi:hypothetical protein